MSDAGDANTSVTVPGTGTSIELGDLKASIAAELASELSTPQDIQKRYGFSASQWKALRANPMFRGMVAEALKTFRGPLAAGQRITKKAEILLEDSMPVLYQIIHDGSTPSDSRIKAMNQLAELAGRGKKDTQDAGPKTPAFTLNINVGNDKPITIVANEQPSDV
jgi:hypothetical protein